jgi:hypothetical protein
VVQDSNPGRRRCLRDLAGRREKAEGGLVSEFQDWEDLRAQLHDGDDEALAAERARTEA